MTSSKITKLLPCEGKKHYVDVYADGELVLTITEDAVIEAGLREGQALDCERLAQIEYSVSLSKAKAKAYDLLSYGDMSFSTLCKKLESKGFDADISYDACMALQSLGYIDDARYAAALAGYLAKTKLYGPRRILQELCHKGIERELADAVIEEIDADFDENIRKLVCGKFRFDKYDRKSVSKAFASLVRYGYDYDMISSVVSDTEDDYE